MRILLTSDLHCCEPLFLDPAEQQRKVLLLAEQAPALGADVLIIAGDITDGGSAEYRRALEPFSSFSGPRLAVAGNHDLGFEEPSARRRALLPSNFADNGFHYLDNGPLVIGTVAFVGNMGWYDGSFPPGRAHPQPAVRTQEWDELARVWRDSEPIATDPAAHVGDQDVQLARELLERLVADIEGLPEQVETIVAVTHHVPLAEALDPEHPHGSMHPIMGSQAIGDALLAHPRVSVCLYAHSHVRRRFTAGRMLSVNHCLARHDATWGVVEIPARRP